MGKVWRLTLAVVVLALGLGNRLGAQEGKILAPKSLRFQPSSSKAPAIAVPAALAPGASAPSATGPAAPAPSKPAAVVAANACNSCAHCCSQRRWFRGGFLQRLREWLKQRTFLAPRECKCRHTCAPCVPHPHGHVSCRCSHGGHASAQHVEFPPVRSMNNLRAPAPTNIPAPTPLDGALVLPPLRVR